MASAPQDTISRQLLLPDADTTAQLGVALSKFLEPADVLLLSGPIGAGKSHLARATIRALFHRHDAPDEDIPSPTYTLVQSYEIGIAEIWHADLYRLSGPDEIPELGLDAAFDDAICLVEWPDRLGELTPAGALSIDLEPLADSDGRRATLSWSLARWSAIVDELLNEIGQSA